nr:MAG TPA: hypothetical protein [Caudoviricetes sp.]DAR31306.1 MAG TPA: hypothetical protein [Bacteriophage sp.]
MTLPSTVSPSVATHSQSVFKCDTYFPLCRFTVYRAVDLIIAN